MMLAIILMGVTSSLLAAMTELYGPNASRIMKVFPRDIGSIKSKTKDIIRMPMQAFMLMQMSMYLLVANLKYTRGNEYIWILFTIVNVSVLVMAIMAVHSLVSMMRASKKVIGAFILMMIGVGLISFGLAYELTWVSEDSMIEFVFIPLGVIQFVFLKLINRIFIERFIVAEIKGQWYLVINEKHRDRLEDLRIVAMKARHDKYMDEVIIVNDDGTLQFVMIARKVVERYDEI